MKNIAIAAWVLCIISVIFYQGLSILKGEKMDILSFSKAITSIISAGSTLSSQDKQDEIKKTETEGDGPVDAIFKAIKKIYGQGDFRQRPKVGRNSKE